MSRRRTITVTFINASCAHVCGHGARDLLIDASKRKRKPVWSSLSRAWTCQPPTARDVVAVAESRGWNVVIHGEPPTGAELSSWDNFRPEVDTEAVTSETGLW